MTTYAIGDLQGCLDPLHRLLDVLRFDPARDRLWFCGDLVNRGAQSLEVLRFVRQLGEGATSVLGNHDLHLLARAQGGRAGRRDTLDAVLAAPDAAELLDWLRQRPLLHEAPGWALVHAGIDPAWTLTEARRAAREIENALRGPGLSGFLGRMYGDEPRRWQPDLGTEERLRHAVNVFTRMRYVEANGALDLGCKLSPTSTMPGLVPWFAHPDRKRLDAEVIFGHWSTLGHVHWAEHRIWGIDTGAVWGGRLSALDLDTRQLSQIETPEYRRLDEESGD